MPIYEYKCQKCSNEYEELVFGNQVPPCPHCGDEHPELLISRACVRGSSSADDFSAGDYQSAYGGGSCGGGGCGSCSSSSCAGCAH
ncbi:MAG: zinc ribbon domain-containing protein [Desulfovibrio sp.]|jgi:putative FmdB family regulatory protein|nr:zinc ribbon domain-containing protein [Desulfovibrio sp.]